MMNTTARCAAALAVAALLAAPCRSDAAKPQPPAPPGSIDVRTAMEAHHPHPTSSCSEYKFKSQCNSFELGCQWCNSLQVNGTQCVPKTAQCSQFQIPKALAKHGVRYGQTVRDVAQHLTPQTPQRGRRDPTGNVLYGFFVRPCDYYGKVGNDDVSEFDTRRYDRCYGEKGDNCTYELDRTYYVGDPECVPNESDVLYKLNLHGQVNYWGENAAMPGSYKASMHWTGATLFVNGDKPTFNYVLSDLKDCCPNVTWTTDKWITVTEKDCNGVDPSGSQVCNTVSGSTDYFNYKWIDDMHYVTSRDDFEKLSGWNNPIDENYLREKIEQSGNQNPEDCTTLLWNECGKAIQQAETNCKSCGEDGGGDSNLECEGCLFRELNPMEGPNRWDPRSQTNRWHKCCPCVNEYADNIDRNWLNHAANHC